MVVMVEGKSAPPQLMLVQAECKRRVQVCLLTEGVCVTAREGASGSVPSSGSARGRWW